MSDLTEVQLERLCELGDEYGVPDADLARDVADLIADGLTADEAIDRLAEGLRQAADGG